MSKKTRMEVRRELAFWQRGAVALIVLLVIFAICAAHLLNRSQERREQLEQEIATIALECTTLRGMRDDAVAQLGETVQEFEAYRAQVAYDRAMAESEYLQQMAAYEAVGMYRYIGTCILTAYCCESKGNPHICGTGTGLTASGLPVAPGMVAVDPSIIPLGSTVIINGVSYLAADTGVIGYHIDIAIQTHEEAAEFGVSSAEVWIIPPGGDQDGN